MNRELGRLVAVFHKPLNVHPLHNNELHRYLIANYGLASTTEILAAACESLALHRRRHLLAFLEQQ
jgi:hypothetical protein